MLDFKLILGEHDSEPKRREVQRAYDEMTQAGVLHALATKVCTDIYGKAEIRVGERDELIAATIKSAAKPIEKAILPFPGFIEKRKSNKETIPAKETIPTAPVVTEDAAVDIAADKKVH